MHLRLLLVSALLLAAASGCSRDCDVICEKIQQCTKGDEDSLELCRRQCELDAGEDQRAKKLDACATCYDETPCAKLFPGDPSTQNSCLSACTR